MLATIPTSLVDNEYELFPEGTFVGKLADAKTRTFDGGDAVINVSITDTEVVEGDQDPGGRTFTGRITFTQGGLNVLEVSNFGDNTLPFGIRRAGGLLAGLAEAVGAVQRDPSGAPVALDLEAFVDSLLTGEYAAAPVRFTVTHYTPKKSGSKARDEFLRIGPAS